jgi:nucleoside-diphosphate-sugar epimerase
MVTDQLTSVVLGATGFAGRALVRSIERDPGSPARCLVRTDVPRPSADHITYVRGTLLDLPGGLFPSSPHVIYHLATQQHDPGRRGFVAENLANARALGDHINSHCRGLIYTSSLSVLGQGTQSAVDETARVAPDTELAAARAAVESYLLDLGRQLGFSVFSVRTRFVLGDGDSRTLPGLHRFLRTGLMPGVGGQRFSVIDVDDLADVLRQLGRRCRDRHETGSPSQIPVHLGYRRPISMWEIRRILRAETGEVPAVVIPLPQQIRGIGVLPSPRLRALVEKLRLFGLSHWSKVDLIESEIGTATTGKDPREMVREAARWMVRERAASAFGAPHRLSEHH